jgi:hypothetical protein
MLENFDDALLYLRILHNFLLKIGSTNLLDSGFLLHLLRLIEVMNFTIEILINEFVKVLLNIVEEDDFSVLLEVKVVVS